MMEPVGRKTAFLFFNFLYPLDKKILPQQYRVREKKTRLNEII